MKKLIAMSVAVVMLLLAATPVMASPRGIDLNGPHFNLNLIGKADGWNDKEVTNPDRHTMFVPENTANWNILLKTPNKIFRSGTQAGENVTSLPGFAIYMTQGTEFAVVDGTAFDGDPCEFTLGPGKYAVYVVAKAKPVDNPPQIDGWIQVKNALDNNYYYYLNIGSVTVSRQWQNATDLFMVSCAEIGSSGLPAPTDCNEWVFSYLNRLEGMPEYSETAYFWQLQNNGSKLIQVRFYKIG